MSSVIDKRNELLFIYDVKDANPNGDPLDENKPRIDEESGVNIVTDVRLKRTIRDYLYNYKGHNGEGDKDIFVREIVYDQDKGFIKDGKSRALDFGKKKADILGDVLKKCIDIRLFGGVIPLDKDSITFTGPVQFKMGRSIHRVALKHIKGTGAFASKQGAMHKTFREEYILPYSLIAFHGVVNENAAKHTELTEADLAELKEAMWEGTKNLLSRSKMGHSPRLLLNIEYNMPGFFIGELDKYIKTSIKAEGVKESQEEQIRDIEEIELDGAMLRDKLAGLKDKISKVELKIDPRVKLVNFELPGDIKFEKVIG